MASESSPREARNRDTRVRAEEALVRFALLAGDHISDFVVIGGLNPDFLAPGSPVPHQGTTDVDLLFELGLLPDRDEVDFSWLDPALRQGGFAAAPGSGGWRWNGTVGAARVRLDLLCDVADSPNQTVHLPGATEAAAQNIDGPAAALMDPIERHLTVTEAVRSQHPDAPEQVALRFASLGGYIVAKAAALLSRDADKDAYDLMFVLMYAPGGPRAAALAALGARVPVGRPATGPIVRAAVKKFADPSGRWVSVAVAQLIAAGDDADEAQLRTDVAVAAQTFLTAFAEPESV